MSPDDARLLRWYPAGWRARYGDEMAALLEDTYGAAAAVPMGQRAALIRRGLAERGRAEGVWGGHGDAPTRQRAGALLVLCGWALCLVGMALFGKATDNWVAGTPVPGRWLPSAGVVTVAVAGAAGCLCVLLAGVTVAPAFVRLLRAGRWPEVRSVVTAAVAMSLAAVALLGGVVAWAHHLSAHDRNGGLAPYSGLVVAAGLSVIAAIGGATAAAVAVGRRVELPAPLLRRLASLAVGLTALMLLVLAGLVAWWAPEAMRAGAVLRDVVGNGVPYASATVPPTLLAAGALVAAGLGIALWGSARVRGGRAASSGADRLPPHSGPELTGS